MNEERLYRELREEIRRTMAETTDPMACRYLLQYADTLELEEQLKDKDK